MTTRQRKMAVTILGIFTLLHSLPTASRGEALAMPPPPADVQPVGGWTLEQEWNAAHVLPSVQQVAWQRMGFIAFLHFGVNTFTERGWGNGDENPALFYPVDMDARHWARVLKAAGMKQLMLTAKHHDGFCLWPSRFTDHSVKSSYWKGGKGDVMRELADACREEGLKVGVYLSPADLNAIKRGVYGKTEVKHRVIPTPVPGWTPKSAFRMEGDWDEYNTYFMNQLFELLTEYGPIHEVWFDGANPKDIGEKYAQGDWFRLIRALAPEAVIMSGRDLTDLGPSDPGPDVRWVGNEGGRTRPNEWNVLSVEPMVKFWPADLGSRAVLTNAPGFRWYPAETDVPIGSEWFYKSKEEMTMSSLWRLLDMWYGAVGGNGVLLLNVPPNKEGLLGSYNVKRLEELGQVLRMTFATNLAAGATAKADSGIPGHEAALTLDGRDDTCWRPADWRRTGSIEFALPGKRRFNVVELKEDITHFGQRVEKYQVEAREGGQWKLLAEAGVIGARRLHRLTETVETDCVRVRFLQSRVCPTLAEFGLYLAPTIAVPPTIVRSLSGSVTIRALSSERIHYTTNGEKPTVKSALYQGPFDLPDGGLVQAMVETDATSLRFGEPLAVMEFGPAKKDWKVLSVSSVAVSIFLDKSEHPQKAEYAIDENPNTEWNSEWRLPQDLAVDMGKSHPVCGFTYLPLVFGSWVRGYAFLTSEDGKTWTPASEGEFDNIQNSPTLQTVRFPARPARYFKFVARTSADGRTVVRLPEIGVLVGK